MYNQKEHSHTETTDTHPHPEVNPSLHGTTLKKIKLPAMGLLHRLPIVSKMFPQAVERKKNSHLCIQYSRTHH